MTDWACCLIIMFGRWMEYMKPYHESWISCVFVMFTTNCPLILIPISLKMFVYFLHLPKPRCHEITASPVLPRCTLAAWQWAAATWLTRSPPKGPADGHRPAGSTTSSSQSNPFNRTPHWQFLATGHWHTWAKLGSGSSTRRWEEPEYESADLFQSAELLRKLPPTKTKSNQQMALIKKATDGLS